MGAIRAWRKALFHAGFSNQGRCYLPDFVHGRARVCAHAPGRPEGFTIMRFFEFKKPLFLTLLAANWLAARLALAFLRDLESRIARLIDGDLVARGLFEMRDEPRRLHGEFAVADAFAQFAVEPVERAVGAEQRAQPRELLLRRRFALFQLARD